jgi:Domain of unknown function (DUF4124)
MNNQSHVILFILPLLFCTSSMADLYSWTDSNGVKRYTTSPPPKGTANVSVTSITENNEAPSPVQKINKTNKSQSIANPVSTGNNKLTKAEEDEIDREIQALWKKHWSDLEKGDIDAALQHYTPSSRKRYRPVLETLYGNKKR